MQADKPVIDFAWIASHLDDVLEATTQHVQLVAIPLLIGFILALGDTVQQGKAALKELRQAQLNRYLTTLKSVTIYDRADKVIPALKDVVENP